LGLRPGLNYSALPGWLVETTAVWCPLEFLVYATIPAGLVGADTRLVFPNIVFPQALKPCLFKAIFEIGCSRPNRFSIHFKFLKYKGQKLCQVK
jgi:hypothetical protein